MEYNVSLFNQKYLLIMDQTINLVNQWASFKESHPNGDIEDFCRYYLVNTKENKKDDKLLEGVIPSSYFSA